MTERFLSVLLGAQHLVSGGPAGTAGLVLEYESGQWVLYHLAADDQIISPMFPGTIEAAFEYAAHIFGVRPEDWTDDSKTETRTPHRTNLDTVGPNDGDGTAYNLN